MLWQTISAVVYMPLIEFDTSVICHVFVLFWLISLALNLCFFKNLQAFALEGQDMMFSMKVLLAFIL